MNHETESKYKSIKNKINANNSDSKTKQLKNLIQKYEYEKTLALIRRQEEKIPNILDSLNN